MLSRMDYSEVYNCDNIVYLELLILLCLMGLLVLQVSPNERLIVFLGQCLCVQNQYLAFSIGKLVQVNRKFDLVTMVNRNYLLMLHM